MHDIYFFHPSEEDRSLMMMLLMRNRSSRAVSKPAMVADHSHQSTNHGGRTLLLPSPFGSPKFMELINNHTFYSATAEAMMRSPTSVLDSKALSPSSSLFGFVGINPFSYAKNSNNKSSQQSSSSKSSIIQKIESKGIGLALLVSDLDDEKKNSGAGDDDAAEGNKGGGNVLFGTQLRLKMKELQKSEEGLRVVDHDDDGHGLCLSLSEMELCEEYTCVISHHGPNPKTTHIFNNSIVHVEENHFCVPQNYSDYYYPSTTFLSFCFTCNKHLDHTMDIFIYKGEKAFCSPECRYKEMQLDGYDLLSDSSSSSGSDSAS